MKTDCRPFLWKEKGHGRYAGGENKKGKRGEKPIIRSRDADCSQGFAEDPSLLDPALAKSPPPDWFSREEVAVGRRRSTLRREKAIKKEEEEKGKRERIEGRVLRRKRGPPLPNLRYFFLGKWFVL